MAVSVFCACATTGGLPERAPQVEHSTRVMTALQVFVEVPGSSAAVKVVSLRFAPLTDLAARAFFQRDIRGIRGVADGVRSFRGNKCSEKKKSQNRDQHRVPATESRGSPRRR